VHFGVTVPLKPGNFNTFNSFYKHEFIRQPVPLRVRGMCASDVTRRDVMWRR